MTIVEVNGQEIEFPPEMTQDEIKGVLRQKFGSPKNLEQPKPRLGKTLLEQGLQGATFGFADEVTTPFGVAISALMQEPKALLTGEFTNPALIEQASTAQKQTQESLKQQMQQRPAASVSANIAGSLMTGVAGASTKAGAALGNMLRSGGAASRIVKGAGTGAALSGLYGAGAAEEGQRLKGAGEAAILGGVVGGSIPAAGAAIKSGASLASQSVRGGSVRSVEQLDEVVGAIREKSSAAYQRMRDVGATFNPQGAEKIRVGLESALEKDGPLNPRLHDKTLAVMDDIRDFADKGNIGLEQLDQWRQVLGDIAGNFTDKVNARKASILIEAIDDVADDVASKPQYLANGTPEAIEALKLGRQEWARASKFNRVLDVVRNAQGDAYKLKRDLEKMLQNKKKTRGFSLEEMEALKKAATQTTGEGVIKLLGKFGFDLGSGRAVGNTGLPLIGGVMAGLGSGTMGAGVALPIIGTAARQAQKNISSLKADELLKVIEGTGTTMSAAQKKQILSLPPKQASKILDALYFTAKQQSANIPNGVK